MDTPGVVLLHDELITVAATELWLRLGRPDEVTFGFICLKLVGLRPCALRASWHGRCHCSK